MPPVKSNKSIERKAKVFALFGDPTRLSILQLIMRKETLKVSDIATGVGMSVACISHHLQLLKDNKIVTSSREGNSIYYQLNKDPLVENLKTLIK